MEMVKVFEFYFYPEFAKRPKHSAPNLSSIKFTKLQDIKTSFDDIMEESKET